MDGFVGSFENPDKTIPYAHGSVEVVKLGGGSVNFQTLTPGWRWSNDLRPILGTDSCPARHVGYCLTGQLHVELDDGGALDIKAGDLFIIPPGHDGWTVGDDTCTLLDWGAMAIQPAPAGSDGGRA